MFVKSKNEKKMWLGNHQKRNQIQKLMGVVDMCQLKKKM
jgi:hypothetical protein